MPMQPSEKEYLEMETYDEILEHIRSLQISRYHYLVRYDFLLVHPAERGYVGEHRYHLWLAEETSYPVTPLLHLTLHGAQMGNCDMSLLPSTALLLDIISIRDRQWEGLYYAIWELDQTEELFCCRSLEACIEEDYML